MLGQYQPPFLKTMSWLPSARARWMLPPLLYTNEPPPRVAAPAAWPDRATTRLAALSAAAVNPAIWVRLDMFPPISVAERQDRAAWSGPVATVTGEHGAKRG